MRTFSGNLASPKGNPTRMFQPYKAISWGCCLCIRSQTGMWPDSKPWLCTTNTNTHKQRLVLHSPAGGTQFILGAPVPQRQAPSVAIIDGRGRECTGTEGTLCQSESDCCATHMGAALRTPFVPPVYHLWGGAILNWA